MLLAGFWPTGLQFDKCIARETEFGILTRLFSFQASGNLGLCFSRTTRICMSSKLGWFPTSTWNASWYSGTASPKHTPTPHSEAVWTPGGQKVQEGSWFTWEQVAAPPEALPVQQTQSVHVYLLQSRFTVSEVQRSSQNLRGHVPNCPHLQTQPISSAQLTDYTLITSQEKPTVHTSDMAMVSSSPGRQVLVPVSFIDKPKSARTQDRSDRTKTFLLVRSLWATGGLYWSEWEQTQVSSGLRIKWFIF